jgi:hypothetical protein
MKLFKKTNFRVHHAVVLPAALPAVTSHSGAITVEASSIL